MSLAALERVLDRAGQRRGAAAYRCGVCAEPVPVAHRHLLAEPEGAIQCACAACSLLFAPVAAHARYRLIPQRRFRLGLPADPADELNIPVGLAFFVLQPDGRVVAHYPSPLGTTQAEVEPAMWAALRERAPRLDTLEPRVEGFVVRGAGRAGEQWVLPIDDCYRLVAVIRRHWVGMAGGSALWRELAGFFADLQPE